MMSKIKINENVLNGFKSEIAKLLLASSSNKFLGRIWPPVDTIYHYTTLQGFLSILESQTLFCSNIFSLNDKAEYIYGIELIKEVVNDLKEDLLFLSELNTINGRINNISKSEKYVTCFSKNGDVLSQWRAYSNNGKGVAIGFKFSFFEDSLDQCIEGVHIDYDRDFQFMSVKELINMILKYFEQRKEFFDWSGFDYEIIVADVCIELLGIWISGFKHPSFSEEQEYRFIYEVDGVSHLKGDEKTYFRATDNMLVSYIKLKTLFNRYREEEISEGGGIERYSDQPFFQDRNLPISKIIVGPSLDFQILKEQIQELLLTKGYMNVVIEKSCIPYRI